MEHWKDIPGHPGYQASTLGRIRSVDRRLPDGRHRRGCVLRPAVGSNGYAHVNLNNQCCCSVHALVAVAFLGPRPHSMEVCHADGNKRNNSLSNLRYDTHSNNVIDNYRLGRHRRARFTTEMVRDIRRRVAAGERQCDLAAEYTTTRDTICDIVHGKKYAWVN